LSVPNNVFDRVNVAECNLIVPMDTKSLYKATDVWKDFNIVAKSMGIIVDSDFDFASNGDGKTVMVIGYHGNGESMIIPSKLHDRFALKDYPVTSIGESAFANCNTIRSVTIPPSITSIGENAFESCLMLNTVTVQWETPLSVPNNIFSGVNVSECELVVPDGTASLYGVANVWKNFILPNFLIIPFSSLDFIAAGEKTTFNIVSNVKWVVSSSETWATVSPTLSYNNGTVTITASANTATTPRTATISVIGDQLPTQRITITQTAAAPPVSTTFDSGNFRFRINENGTSCTLIKYTGSQSDVVIPAAATYSGKSYSVTAIANAFELNLDLVSVTIPNSVTGIEASAFNNCRNLQDIVIPNSVTSIGERAFFNCNGLFSATLSNSLKSIGNSAFSACENLKAINIPNSVTSIGNSAFDHCASLPSVVIPSSVTAIGDGVFNMCRSLKSVTIPNTVTSIGERAFFYCFSLPSITIPNSVKIIGEEAFANCDLLTTVSIPASVTSLAASAFESCGGLTAINVASNNPNYTGDGGVLFNKNKTLLVKYPGGKSGEYTIPASVTAIGKDAFSSSYEITAVTIPATVTSIGETAFGYCTRLKKVTVQWQTPLSVPDDVFTYNNVAECDLVVPPGKENLYRAAPVWKDFRIATTSVLSLSPSSLSFPAAGGEKNISITANSPWTASSSASWLFSTPFGTSTGTVIVEAAANTTVTQRTASIVFSNGVITQTVSVAQAAAELPTENSQSIVITPDNVIINGEGGMNISLKIPTEGTFTISFIITLPQGFILDLSATALVSALSGRYDLNITPVASGKWRFDIIPKPLRSGMETNDLVRISCNVDNSVSSGSHNIVFNDINIILDSGQVIHQDEMNVPVKVTATSAELPTPSSVSFSSPFLKVFSPLAEQISIYSPAGALVFRADKPAGQSEYDLSNLPKGIMIARGSSGWARKIVVR
jgi:hypothetical protein